MSVFAGPFPAGAVIARLQERVPGIRQLGRITDLQQALQQPPAVATAAFVLVRETGGPAGSTGRHMQPVRVAVSLVLFVRNYAGQRGGPALDDAEALASDTRPHLVGWTPIPKGRALWFESGRALHYAAGQQWWQDVYRTDYRLTGDTP